jgi:uncharacterized protein
MMLTTKIDLPTREIVQICEAYGIQKLALFGSVLHSTFNDDSDVDLLVEFKPDARIGWQIVTVEDELSHVIGRKVDLRTPQELSRYFRDTVMQEAQVIYERP